MFRNIARSKMNPPTLNHRLFTISLVLFLCFATSGRAQAVTFRDWQSVGFFGSSRADVVKALGKPDESDKTGEMDTYLISDSPNLMMMGLVGYENDQVSGVFAVCQPSVTYAQVCDLQKKSLETKLISEDASNTVFEFTAPQKSGARFLSISPSDDSETGPMFAESIINPHGEGSKTPAERTTSLDEILASVAKSLSATAELVRDPSRKVPLEQNRFNDLLDSLNKENLEAVDYPFPFIPEYKVTFDTGVSYNMFQDMDKGKAGFNPITVLKFNGSDVIYKGGYKIFTHSHPIKTKLSDDFAYMHTFADGSDKATSIEALMRSPCVIWAMEEYATSIGVVPDDSNPDISSFRVDGFTIADLTNVDPHLVSVKVDFSLKPKKQGTMPALQGLREENGWISGNHFAGAIWVENGKTGCRAYALGFDAFTPDAGGSSQSEVATSIYERSYAKKRAK